MQWNLKGFRSRLGQLKCLIQEYQPEIIALQETKLPPGHIYNNRKYHIYRKDRSAHGGGVALMIDKNLSHSLINITSPLEVVAATIHYKNQNITICSLYLPPGIAFPERDFKLLLPKLPKPFLILGDTNSKHPLWGSPDSDHRGVKLAKILEDKILHTLNNGNPTYHDIHTNYFSHLDTSICTPDINLKFNWDTETDLYDSDHFPIILAHNIPNLYTEAPQRFNLEKTTPENLRNYSNTVCLPEFFFDANISCQEITEHILEVANQYVTKTSGKISTKYSNPWWNDECAQAVKNRKDALKLFNRVTTLENLNKYKKARAKARQTINHSKRVSWCRFVTSINRFTPVATVWKKIKKIDSKPYSNTKIVLKENEATISNPTEIIEKFGDYFSNISSNNNYTHEFILYKNAKELEQINFDTENNITLNEPFIIPELESVLNPSKNTTPGEDTIPYELYNLLPIAEKQKLIKFLNFLWLNHIFPDQWRNAHTIPILKPGKTPTSTNSYRPISLTNTLCKIMEKMIKNRLMQFLLTNNIIAQHQYGFQKGKSTLDPLTHLEYAIRETIIRGQYLVVVFLDIEKAYDMVWGYGLLQDLLDIGLRGNLPIFIQNFLKNRTLQVKIANFISTKYNLENGLPQGSILSVALFLIIINNMFKNCTDTINRLFCDDGCFWSRALDLDTAETNIQNTLNHLTKWSKEKGLKFSTQKSTYCIFTHKTYTRDLTLTLYNEQLPRSYQVKYLGMTFDHRLNWNSHTILIKEKCQKRINILRCVSKRKWGADRKTLKMLYLSLIQSTINYASFLYGAAGDENLKTLNKIQYEGIRIITGALRCTRTSMLEAEAHLMPLDLRRHFLGLTFLGRAARMENSLTANLFANHHNFQIFEIINKPLPWIAHAHYILDNMNSNLGDIAKLNDNFIYNPPKLDIKFTLHTSKKANLTTLEVNNAFREMINKYENHTLVFTDGSVKDDKTGCAVIIKNQSYTYRLPNHTSIFTAELTAISKAIDKIIETDDNLFLICSDSYSALQALKSGKSNSITHEIMNKISNTNKNIKFEWCPSHMDIPGNSEADQKAGESLNLTNPTAIPLTYHDFRILVKKHLKNKWQNKWDNINTPPNQVTHLYPTKPVLKDWDTANRKNREEDVILARLRLCTCLINKKHIITKDPYPQCEYCQVDTSIEHVLIHCPQYSNERIPIIAKLRKDNLPICITNILNNDFQHTLLFTFLQKIQHYSKI